MDNTEQILNGGVVTKKSRVIFFNYNDVRDWSIFNYIEPFDNRPGRVNNKDKLKHTVDILKAPVSFNKDDLYKQINKKAYYCYVGEATVKFIDLTSIKIGEFLKRTTGKKTGGYSLASALFETKTDYLNQTVTDILNMSTTKNRGDAYKEILSKLNINSLSELLNNNIQMGGYNVVDGYVPIEPSDLESSNLESLFGGQIGPPKLINLKFPVEDNEQSYKIALEYLQRKQEIVNLSLNAVIIINENIIGNDSVEHIYF